MKQTLTILVAVFLVNTLTAAQSIEPPGPEQIRSVGRMAISERPALPAVIGGDKEGWVGGEVPPFTPPEKPMVDVPMRDMDVSRGPDGTYYLTGTVENFWRGNPGIPLWKSRDLKNWESVGFVWTFAKDAKADWQKGKLNPDGTRTPKPMWGPRFHYIKGQWYVVYCIEHLGCGILKSTSGRPEGPFIDLKPDGPIKGYDAALFEDEDGQVYFLNGAGSIAKMKPDLSDLAEPLRRVTMAPDTQWHHCEGSHMYKFNGRYYLFVAQGTDHSKDGERAGLGSKVTYDVWAMSAPTPYGPFENRHLAFLRAGRNTVFQDNSGHWWATWGCSGRGQSVGMPFWEKPAIIPIEMDSEGKLRQVTSSANPSAPGNAEKIVSRYEGVWTAPPKKVPSNRNSDAPLLGNGDIGVLIGGAPEKQQFFISKCDFWRPQPYFWWFTPALVGAFDLEIPALEGASYKAVQDIAKAEVRQTFTRPEGTVELRSWTPATGHELIVEISCSGKPVEIKASPWTYFGNGATVENGRNDGVSWLTRSFTGPGYDWDSQATLAVNMEGSSSLEKNGDLGNPTQPPTSRSDVATTKIPAGKVPVTIGGRLVRNKQKGQFSNPFKGQIHGVGLYDRVLTEKEIAQLQKGQALGDKPVFASGDIGASTGDPGNPDGVSIGETIIPSKSYTLILDVTPELAAGRILAFGEPGNGIEVSQDPHGGGGYFLTVKAAGHLVSSLDNLPAKKRITAAITFDGSALLLCANGKTSGTRRIDATPRTLTLQPGKPVRLVAAVRTNQERPDFQADAIKGAKSLDAGAVARLQEEHRQWWRNFWNESSVEIGDPVLEGYYYGSFYIMACCSRNKEFAAPLFGNWASGDVPAMGGDYHMNYNYPAPWWGCFAANHIGLTDPYDTPMLQYVERGKIMATNYLGRKGIYFCAGIAPKGSCACWEHPHDGWKEDSAKKHYFAGQKCNALFGGINMAMRWNATRDPDYARKSYPYLRELAAFWEDDLVWESAPYEVDRNNLYDLNPSPGREGVIRKEGRYSILHDNVHEGGPAKEGDKNNPMSLGFLRSCLKATLEMSRELGVDADKREKWQHILDHLSGYTVFDREGKKIFRYSEEGRDFDLRGVTCGLMHLYPGDAVGLESSPEMLEISRNSIEQHPKAWKSRNTTMNFYPAMARIGYPPQAILEGLHALIDECGFPNYVIDRGGGGGIETCSTVTTTIDEMLLQSLQGVIRLFPNWPKDKDARFDKLRAYGAFLVSAEIKSGNIQSVRILSERGQPCTLRNPWPGKKAQLIRNGKPAEALAGDLVKFTTAAGDIVDLKPE